MMEADGMGDTVALTTLEGQGPRSHPSESRQGQRAVSDGAPSRKRTKVNNPNGPPLQRGLACVQCRHRKMKCSGTQPSCENCTRRNERCIYDYGRTLDSSDNSPVPHPYEFFLPSPLPGTQPLPAAGTGTEMMYSYGMGAPTAQYSVGNWNNGSQPQSFAVIPPQDNFGSYSPHTVYQTYTSPIPGVVPVIPRQQQRPMRPSVAIDEMTAPPLKRSHSTTDARNMNFSMTMAGPSQYGFDTHVVDLGNVRELFTMRFFSPTSIYQARDCISETRYRARLSLDPSMQPSLSLQHAICMLGSSSMAPEDRSRTQKLYGLAKVALEEDLNNLHFPFDAVIASHMLASWLWRQGRMIEAHLMNGKHFNRLAIACGLHCIPSSTWLESAMFVEEPTGMPAVLGPAIDTIELCERIHIFHAIVALDLGSSLATQWPSVAAGLEITTPLPQPFPESPSAIPSTEDIATPSLSGKIEPSMYSAGGCTLESASLLALRLLYRTVQLQHHPDEPSDINSDASPHHGTSMPSPESNAPNSPASLRSNGRPARWSRTPRFRTHTSFRLLRDSLDRLESTLPRHLKDVKDWDVAVLHILINTARMRLYDIQGDSIDHDEAYRRASGCAGLINTLTYNVFRPGIFGPFTAVPWLMVLKVLHTESQRERRLHRDNEAASALDSARSILTALKARALSCGVAAELERRGTHLVK